MGTWQDFDQFVNYFLPKQTIPRLRQFALIVERHARIRLGLKSQERKADLVSKIQIAFQTMRRTDQATTYIAARRECEAIVNNNFAGSSQVLPQPTFGTVTSVSHSAARHQNPIPSVANGYGAGGSGSGWQRGASSANGSNLRASTLVDWKPSPMWRPVKALTNMEMLPDIQTNEHSHTHREKRVLFSLPTDVIEGLNKTKSDPRSRPAYSVRLFCASSDYYRPPGMAPYPGVPVPSNRCVPIEYPTNPDASVDSHTVPFKERGLRGKAGSAPPLDLDKSSRGLVRTPGRMASLIMGHTGPTPTKKKEFSKKFWFQVVYCEYISIEDLLVKLESLAPTDPEVELARLRKAAAEEDEIEVGTSTLSLKDPLSGMRITKPIRSSKCSHLQCFDAKWWLESNRSHPQWHCPHCSKELSFDDIICDGYFLSILRAVPDSFDEVTLESNGEWHTQNNQYGSTDWLAEHGAAPPITATSIKRARSSSPIMTPGKRRAIEILSDSDDGDESETPATSLANGTNGYASTNGNSRAVSHTARSTASAQPLAIIDLTLSSDDETDDEDVLHFHRPGGGSTSRDGGASSGARPASETRSHPTWSPKRLTTTTNASSSPAAASSTTVPIVPAPSTATATMSTPRLVLKLNTPQTTTLGAYGGSSSIRDTADSSRSSTFSGGLTAAQILQGIERYGPRASASSATASSSRPTEGSSSSRPSEGLSAAQIMAAAEALGRGGQSSSSTSGYGSAAREQPPPRYDSSWRPTPRPTNGYSHHS